MKKLIAALCFMFAVSPFALAQDKAKDAEKKAAPAKAAPAKAEAKKVAPAKADEKKAAPAKAEKKAKAKKEPTEKQKAQQKKMKDCSKDASDKKLKGDERKKFMSTCMKG
ncbi:MAG: hypothetical protein A3F74_09125 [Betaproteobacteria bacterium RIFCSPLOWO2_12_FULL_62_58]|nr:MAG: hypothetical protein A3F74_09125 [Betaproteobacteria bacterium RIFCSPLOWO2_12_FULL_62_58]